MVSLACLLLDFILGETKNVNERKRSSNFHIKCRNSEQNNEKFFYQSNQDGIKDKKVIVSTRVHLNFFNFILCSC